MLVAHIFADARNNSSCSRTNHRRISLAPLIFALLLLLLLLHQNVAVIMRLDDHHYHYGPASVNFTRDSRHWYYHMLQQATGVDRLSLSAAAYGDMATCKYTGFPLNLLKPQQDKRRRWFELHCPPLCNTRAMMRNKTRSGSASCLNYFSDTRLDDCDSENLRNQLLTKRLDYCCEYEIRDTFPPLHDVSDVNACKSHVSTLRQWQHVVEEALCHHDRILNRYHCHQNFSRSSCYSCRELYRRWVCSSFIPFWTKAGRIRPCRSVCHDVEISCPWYLPTDITPGSAAQYAGQPIFQCIDQNIEETKSQLENSPFGKDKADELSCYEFCYNGAGSDNLATPCTTNKSVGSLVPHHFNMNLNNNHYNKPFASTAMIVHNNSLSYGLFIILSSIMINIGSTYIVIVVGTAHS